LEALGVIESFNSAWGAHLFTVPKMDSPFRNRFSQAPTLN
jgi:hypothetical protein